MFLLSMELALVRRRRRGADHPGHTHLYPTEAGGYWTGLVGLDNGLRFATSGGRVIGIASSGEVGLGRGDGPGITRIVATE